MSKEYDFLIIGGGIIGLGLARALKILRPSSKILIIEKEGNVAEHASGRNSGVLHAGFYYTGDSLKAKFTVLGNRSMKDYCRSRQIPINECGKLVVAACEAELSQLYELERRGKANSSDVRLIDEQQAEAIEPNVRTFKKALYSPDTASVDPLRVCQTLRSDLESQNVEFSLGTQYTGRRNNTVQTTRGDFHAKKIVNAAGLYADKIAHDFGFGKKYTM